MRRSATLLVLLALQVVVVGAISYGGERLVTLYDLIGVGCVSWSPDGSSLAFRPELSGIPSSDSMRVFKYFEGEDTRRCLAVIVNADEELVARARTLGPKTTPADFHAILSAIRNRWTMFGVADALDEVTKEGKRGPKTAALLSRCHELEERSILDAGTRSEAR